MPDDIAQSIKGDKALGPGDCDKLGFREVARRIAVSLVDRASEDGLVIGLEGQWGSGKSSLIYLIGEELVKLSADLRPAIIDFRPWLLGKRDALIVSLFNELTSQLDQVALQAGDATRISVAKAKEAGEALRSFMNGLSKTGALIEVVGKATGLGAAELVGKGVKAIGEATGKAVPPSLMELKEKLSRSLQELNYRFIITIDDVDRLEPAEVIEILRLVRSVMDLPNIIYLLCYDSKILGHSIEVAANVKDGLSYLEKIVQLTIMVPTPESLQLRQWFSDDLRQIASVSNEDERSRLATVIDYEGGRQLRTPRSVVRALDAMRFFWPPLFEHQADLADLVWLQLIKDSNPSLYRWIEDYCATYSVISLRLARVEEAERERRLAELFALVGDGYFNDTMYKHSFAENLPGVEIDLSKEGKHLKLFCAVSDRDRDKAIQKRRLASPDHYRLYFALSEPSHTLSQREFSSMWAAAEKDADDVSETLIRLNDDIAIGSLSKADIFLERVKSGAYKVLSSFQCENILIGLSQAMDQMYWKRSFDILWVGTIWDRAIQAVPLLRSQLEPARRGLVVENIFEHGVALGWLTSVFRREWFAHGRYGDGGRRQPESEWILTEVELDKIAEIMLRRYRALSISKLFDCPEPSSVLFAWLQAGDNEGPRRLIENYIQSDEGLINVLEKLTSTIDSSQRGKYKVLKRENLTPFLDFALVKQRVSRLVGPTELGERARRLVIAFGDGTEI